MDSITLPDLSRSRSLPFLLLTKCLKGLLSSPEGRSKEQRERADREREYREEIGRRKKGRENRIVRKWSGVGASNQRRIIDEYVVLKRTEKSVNNGEYVGESRQGRVLPVSPGVR